MEAKSIKIKGLENEQDANTISNALHHVWGIEKVDVNISRGEASISFDPNMASYEDFLQAIQESGYAVLDELH
ncbi:Copper chaperone CopZ [Fictibacillus solisalsi]|uniref:Copper chaperone CopZ n=1 Tax=Fictibacillus solisalsi TaxID=459525 RepID=A0A1G9YES6_9BACL|nr:heavy-metal-associated domain-containing protein [Fictibacillus solisalsi]SDN07005.1 Copper chaperone CopZ [Fictibacillus solisalsi]